MARVRVATLADAPQIHTIYSWYVTNDISSSEHVPPSLDEFTERIRKTLEFLPYFVAEDLNTGRIIGFAYGSFYHPRRAWRFICTTSVYVDKDFLHHRVGTLMYERLLPALRAQHFVEAYATVTPPNPGSLNFHKKFGFVEKAEFPHLTYKLDFWQSLVFLALELNPRTNPPVELIAFSEVDPSVYQ
jgi:phosphinothricin acetyltransferase